MRIAHGSMPSWQVLGDLIRLRNQTGFFLLLLPTLWALILASEGRPDPLVLIVFVLGAFVMRSAGVVVNDWWDRDLDRHVERTRHRPLASGALQPRVAIMVLFVLLLIAAGLLAMLNTYTIMLAPIAVVLALLYPLAKRVTALPQTLLGVAFGWGVIMAWSAVRAEIGWTAIGIFLATVCWTLGYDTIYALQDARDDARIGIRSSVLFFGPYVSIGVLLAFAVTTAILAAVGAATDLAWPFYLALTAATTVFGYQTWRVRQGVSPTEAFTLFKQHAWLGALILAGIWSGVWMR
jgi:4-hydroxybenzoate polyprenyltransferase